MMKKITFLLGILVLSLSVFSQELSQGLTAKNEGNDAYRNKDYVTAIKKWTFYLESGEEGATDDINTQSLLQKSYKYAANDFMKNKDYQSAYDYYANYLKMGDDEAKTDGNTQYYMAYCANKLNNNDMALSHYQKAIDLDYKPDMCKLYIANIYKEAGEEAKMKELLLAAIEEHPDSKYLDKMAAMLTTPILKDASEPFNEANELTKAAASGNPNDYLTNMAKAVEKFQEAIPLFEKVLKYDPKNELATSYLKVCTENIQQFEDYKKQLNK